MARARMWSPPRRAFPSIITYTLLRTRLAISPCSIPWSFIHNDFAL